MKTIGTEYSLSMNPLYPQRSGNVTAGGLSRYFASHRAVWDRPFLLSRSKGVPLATIRPPRLQAPDRPDFHLISDCSKGSTLCDTFITGAGTGQFIPDFSLSCLKFHFPSIRQLLHPYRYLRCFRRCVYALSSK